MAKDKKTKKTKPEAQKEEEQKIKKPKKDKAEKAKKAERPKDDSWDEETGGGDYFKLPEGETEVLIRIRSVVSLGQCFFEFKGQVSDKAVSALGFILECWPYKIKKDKIVITSDEPAIVNHTFKAMRDNDKSHYGAMYKELGVSSPADFVGMAGMGTVKTTDKGYMYLQKRVFKAGLAERKAVPELVGESHCIPNLNAMTAEALKELNPLTQVHQYVTRAVNYHGSLAEELVEGIRVDKPDFARFDEPKNKDKKGKKGKKNKKKLDESKEY